MRYDNKNLFCWEIIKVTSTISRHCFNLFQNVFLYFPMFQFTGKCFNLQNVLFKKYFTLFQNVSLYFETFYLT